MVESQKTSYDSSGSMAMGVRPYTYAVALFSDLCSDKTVSPLLYFS